MNGRQIRSIFPTKKKAENPQKENFQKKYSLTSNQKDPNGAEIMLC